MKQIEEQVIKEIETEDWETELNQVLSGEEPVKKKKKKWYKNKKRIILIGIITIIIIFLIVVSNLNQGQSSQQVMTSTLERQDVLNSLSIQGPVSGTNSIHVASNLNAEIIEILVKEGDKVERDQLLAVIDDKDVQKEVELAQNAYDLAVANQSEQQTQAKSGYEKARQRFQTASRNLSRLNTLAGAGSVSQVELETAQNEVNDASWEMSTYTLENGTPVAPESYALQVQNAWLELNKKRDNLENTQLKSSIVGTVVRVNSKVGQYADKVEDDKPLFIIENLDSLELKINVSEYSIGKVTLGQPVTIHADILNGDTVMGEVVTISPTGEEKGSGSTERVIPITVRIIEEHSRLIAGITAKADILLEEELDTFAVPISALIHKEEGDYIATVEDQLIHLIPVESGVESDIVIAIIARDGVELKEGMEVVVNPNEELEEGTAVTTEGGL